MFHFARLWTRSRWYFPGTPLGVTARREISLRRITWWGAFARWGSQGLGVPSRAHITALLSLSHGSTPTTVFPCPRSPLQALRSLLRGRCAVNPLKELPRRRRAPLVRPPAPQGGSSSWGDHPLQWWPTPGYPSNRVVTRCGYLATAVPLGLVHSSLSDSLVTILDGRWREGQSPLRSSCHTGMLVYFMTLLLRHRLSGKCPFKGSDGANVAIIPPTVSPVRAPPVGYALGQQSPSTLVPMDSPRTYLLGSTDIRLGGNRSFLVNLFGFENTDNGVRTREPSLEGWYVAHYIISV